MTLGRRAALARTSALGRNQPTDAENTLTAQMHTSTRIRQTLTIRRRDT